MQNSCGSAKRIFQSKRRKPGRWQRSTTVFVGSFGDRYAHEIQKVKLLANVTGGETMVWQNHPNSTSFQKRSSRTLTLFM